MNKTRQFRPTLQPLEERVVLSFSFTSLIHSLFPFIHIADKKPAAPAHAHTPVTRKPVVGNKAHLYSGPRGKAPSNSTALETAGTTPKTVPMYGPLSGMGAAARRLQAARQAHLKIKG
jgi:hypothetical protein